MSNITRTNLKIWRYKYADAYYKAVEADKMQDGDILVFEKEKTIYIVSGTTYPFHFFEINHSNWETFAEGRYLPSYTRALQIKF
jgi:hypothetical protein